jgi:hypothetical protein
MTVEKVVKAADDAKQPSPKRASYVNVSNRILHLESGIYAPGEVVKDPTQAELSNFSAYIKVKE